MRPGDQMGIEHWPAWRARDCPGPSFAALGVASQEAPAPTDYAVGLAEGYRRAVEVVRAALNRTRAEERAPRGVPSDRRGRLVALGTVLDDLLREVPR